MSTFGTNGNVEGFGIPLSNGTDFCLQVDRSAGVSTAHTRDTGTNTQPSVMTLKHGSSAIPAADFGAVLDFQLHDSANLMVEAGNINTRWVTATSGAVTSRMDFNLQVGSTPLTMLTFNAGASGRGQTIVPSDFQHSNAVGKISFFGATTVVQQANASQATITAVTDANAKAALQSLYNLLKNYGLAPATA